MILRLRVTEDEYEVIKMRAKSAEYKSVSSFLRRMALFGYIVKYENQDIKKLNKSLIGIQNNINQISARVNSTNRIYEDDIKYLKSVVNDIWQSLKSVQSNLQSLKQ